MGSNSSHRKRAVKKNGSRGIWSKKYSIPTAKPDRMLQLGSILHSLCFQLTCEWTRWLGFSLACRYSLPGWLRWPCSQTGSSVASYVQLCQPRRLHCESQYASVCVCVCVSECVCMCVCVCVCVCVSTIVSVLVTFPVSLGTWLSIWSSKWLTNTKFYFPTCSLRRKST